MRGPSYRFYLIVLAVSALLAGPAFYFGAWAQKALACRYTQAPDTFLASCDQPQFGDYEHAAFALGLQQDAIRSLRKADVLFLGNSRMQHAFSTAEPGAFFERRDTGYYLLGFGYGENQAFAGILLDAFALKPKVIVINTDPFFSSDLSVPAVAVTRPTARSLVDAYMKRAFTSLFPSICVIPHLCSQTYPSTFRSARSGQWITQDVLEIAGAPATPVPDHKPTLYDRASLQVYGTIARKVLSSPPYSTSCVILTAVPTPVSNSLDVAEYIGKLMNLPVIVPRVENLQSFDGSHLDAQSARRWSAAFLADAAPIIDKCLAPGNPTSGARSSSPR